MTEPIEGLRRNLPALRDVDRECAYKEDAGKLIVAAFEDVGAPWSVNGIAEDFFFDEIPFNFERLAPVLERSLDRVPVLQETGIQTYFNGPEAFTADGRFMMGESSEVENFFVVGGSNSNGIGMGGGMGLAVAEWIVNGRAPFDVTPHDIRRCLPFEGENAFLTERLSETFGKMYGVKYPFYQFNSQRDIFVSPLHQQMKSNGAYFEQVAGWERPRWFSENTYSADSILSFEKAAWWDDTKAEQLAVRKAAGLFDQSSMGKIQIKGDNAVAALNKLCATEVPNAAGEIKLALMLNDWGGIESDGHLLCEGENQFVVFVDPSIRHKTLNWIERNSRDLGGATITDVTQDSGMIGLHGPKAAEILNAAVGADGSLELPVAGGTSRTTIAGHSVVLWENTQLGETGYDLLIDANNAVEAYERIISAGEAHGLKICGAHAYDSCRIENGVPVWGRDVTGFTYPSEIGANTLLRDGKDADYLGSASVKDGESSQSENRLVRFVLEDENGHLFGNEPIVIDGETTGLLTSGFYGHNLGTAVGLGYVSETLLAQANGNATIMIGEKQFAAKIVKGYAAGLKFQGNAE